MIVVHFIVKYSIDRFNVIEEVEDSLEGVDEYIKELVEVIEDSIEDLEELREVV